MGDLLERLGEAMRTANRGWPPLSRSAWVCECLLPALGARMIAVIDVSELAALRAGRDAWRFKCRVDAEQVAAVGLNSATFRRWALTRPGDVLVRSLATESGVHDFNPSAKRWAMALNRCTPTPADAQRLLDEIIACAESTAGK